VINVYAFQGVNDFHDLVRETRDYIKSSPAENGSEVLMPGEGDFRIQRECAKHRIPIDEGTWRSILEAAENVGVTWDPAQAEETCR
jgi:uncharacterized oxidoreductase